MEDTFWSLEDFPTRLVYPAEHPDGVTYVVELFGIIQAQSRNYLTPKSLSKTT